MKGQKTGLQTPTVATLFLLVAAPLKMTREREREREHWREKGSVLCERHCCHSEGPCWYAFLKFIGVGHHELEEEDEFGGVYVALQVRGEKRNRKRSWYPLLHSSFTRCLSR